MVHVPEEGLDCISRQAAAGHRLMHAQLVQNRDHMKDAKDVCENLSLGRLEPETIHALCTFCL